eukprot:349759-Chlamydomonas_euryale.AAC.4
MCASSRRCGVCTCARARVQTSTLHRQAFRYPPSTLAIVTMPHRLSHPPPTCSSRSTFCNACTRTQGWRLGTLELVDGRKGAIRMKWTRQGRCEPQIDDGTELCADVALRLSTSASNIQ